MRILNLLLANLVAVIATLGIALVLEVVAFVFGGPSYLVVMQALADVSIVLSLMTASGFFYRELQSKSQRKLLRDKLESELRLRFKALEDALGALVNIPTSLEEDFIANGTSKFTPEYSVKQAVDFQMEAEVTRMMLGNLTSTLRLTESSKLFLEYVYFSKNAPELASSVYDRIDKAKLEIEGSTEWEFAALRQLWIPGSGQTLDGLRHAIGGIEKDTAEHAVAAITGQSLILERLLHAEDSQRRLANLQRLFDRFITQGYISGKGMLSMVKTKHDILSVLKFEGGLSSSLTMFKIGNIQTPFKRVLLDLGFVQPNRYDFFTFLKAVDDLPEEYRNDPASFVDAVVIPRVKAEWQALSTKYRWKRLQKMTYAYVAFVVKAHEFVMQQANMKFTRALQGLIAQVSPEDSAKVLIDQVHRIPAVVGQMEMDMLIDSATDKQRVEVREAGEAIVDGLHEIGYEITRVIDYRKLKDDQERFARVIAEKTTSVIKTYESRGRLTIKKARDFAKDIVLNAQDLYDLTREMGLPTLDP